MVNIRWGLELETDENGNVIDPPENYGPGMLPSESSGSTHSGQSKPGASTESSGSLKPTVPSGTLPSATTEAVTKPAKVQMQALRDPVQLNREMQTSGLGAASQLLRQVRSVPEQDSQNRDRRSLPPQELYPEQEM